MDPGSYSLLLAASVQFWLSLTSSPELLRKVAGSPPAPHPSQTGCGVPTGLPLSAGRLQGRAHEEGEWAASHVSSPFVCTSWYDY